MHSPSNYKAAALRAGIIGAGLMGRWHADAARHAGASVAAVMDRNAEAADRLAGQYSGTKCFASLDELLDRADLDVLHVCTPLHTHREIAAQAIDAGLHVLVEKPLTPSASETEELLKRAEERSVLLCPVHQFAFQEGARKARAWLPEIGPVVHVAGTFYSAGAAGQPPSQRDAVAADILPHPLSLMQALLPGGMSENAHWRTLYPAPGEVLAAGEQEGVMLSIRISMSARPTVCDLQIAGANGSIHLDLYHGYAYREPGAVSRVRKVLHPFDQSLRRLVAAGANLAGRVLRRQPAYPGLRALVQRFYRAAETGSAPPLSPDAILQIARTRDRLLEQTNLLPQETRAHE